ncbi:MAG: hypothetical protein Kow00107_04450 [Planctomycetota bacterium]
MEMSLDPALLGVMTVLFLIGTVLLWKFLGKPLTEAMDARENKIREDIERAEQARASMENLKLEYEAKMRELEDKAHSIIAAAAKEAKDRSEKLERETHEEIRRRKEMALAELERERAAAVAALKSEVADLAVQIASTVLSREVKKSDHHKIVQDFLADMEKRAN